LSIVHCQLIQNLPGGAFACYPSAILTTQSTPNSHNDPGAGTISIPVARGAQGTNPDGEIENGSCIHARAP
jgi:hypothetical protein